MRLDRFGLLITLALTSACILDAAPPHDDVGDVEGTSEALGFAAPRVVLPAPDPCWWANSPAECSAIQACLVNPDGPCPAPRRIGLRTSASGAHTLAASSGTAVPMGLGLIAPKKPECPRPGGSPCGQCNTLPKVYSCVDDARWFSFGGFRLAPRSTGTADTCGELTHGFAMDDALNRLTGRMAFTRGGANAPIIVVDYPEVNEAERGECYKDVFIPQLEIGAAADFDFSGVFYVMYTQEFKKHPSYPNAQIPFGSVWYRCDGPDKCSPTPLSPQ